ncbi:probable 2-oxoglutarate-dependent dioxygenase AOP1 [Asparagus officinalis]|uniref:probable 2-oxoglutarate-dependent dioxygenase AOP1 n=1 Tax=Asparagus officinalis TaxID=4686 RepID=UPI00098E1A06|nr:probable 2-oxoglutarate-dependent dioxygenase AOP1 [Asparagus officinalis]
MGRPIPVCDSATARYSNKSGEFVDCLAGCLNVQGDYYTCEFSLKLFQRKFRLPKFVIDPRVKMCASKGKKEVVDASVAIIARMKAQLMEKQVTLKGLQLESADVHGAIGRETWALQKKGGSKGTHIDLTKDPKALEPGTPQWEATSRDIRQALETYGCFLVDYDSVSRELREAMFEEMEPLFALPAEAKRKAAEGTPQSSLVLPGQTPDAPLQQVFGAVGLQEPETAQALTDILWPDGNDKFCQALQSMNKKMGEMALVLKKMIFQSYGLGEYCDSNVDPTEIGFGMVRYSAPMTDEPTKGLSEHIDGTFITILCENDVDGLFTKSSKGEWHRVILKKNTFIVLAGFLLTAWSNGRIHGCLHKVTFKGYKVRKSCGLFLRPKLDQTVETPRGLIDEDHPLRFKPFRFKEFRQYCKAHDFAEDLLDKFAGI